MHNSPALHVRHITCCHRQTSSAASCFNPQCVSFALRQKFLTWLIVLLAACPCKKPFSTSTAALVTKPRLMRRALSSSMAEARRSTTFLHRSYARITHTPLLSVAQNACVTDCLPPCADKRVSESQLLRRPPCIWGGGKWHKDRFVCLSAKIECQASLACVCLWSLLCCGAPVMTAFDCIPS